MQEQKTLQNPVLLVDDEDHTLQSISFILNAAGIINVVTCNDSRQAMQELTKQHFAVVLLDISMPHITGTELLPEILSAFPDLLVIMVTANTDLKVAIDCMKKGAFDYLVKPVDDERLVTCVKHAVELREIRTENESLRKSFLSDELKYPEAFEHIITKNKVMQLIFRYIEAIAQTSLPVLITGETGVGKELIAQAIHKASGRIGKFVAVNVTGVDDHLFSDTLFGHAKGAFTGADQVRKGMIEQAANGTLFLDEIGDLRIESQVKLLRLLQEKNYYPLGSDMPKPSQARIVVATNQDIKALKNGSTFRKDLYYRLQTHHIHIPALRERLDDLPLLTDHLLDEASREFGKKKPSPPRELFDLLRTYDFPGNVRELQGIVYDAVGQHTGGVLSQKVFKEKIGFNQEVALHTTTEHESPPQQIIFPSKLPTLKEVEEVLITEALSSANGNQTVAAQILGLSRRALNNRLSRKQSSSE